MQPLRMGIDSTKSMHICLLADAQSPHTLRWARYFVSRSHQTSIISFRPASISGVEVYTFNSAEKLGKPGYLLYAHGVRKLIRELRPDILHAHHATSYGLLGATSGWHPYLLHTWGRDVLDYPKNPVYKRIVSFNLRQADIVTCTSEIMVQAVQNLVGVSQETRKIPFGVDLEEFKPNDKIRVEDRLVIGTTKSFEPIYGLQYLLKAFSLVAQNNSNIQLILVGDGSQRSYLESLAKELGIFELTEFTGRVSHQEIAAYLALMDIFVVPSLLESFGVAAAEASAMEIPVIASDVGGLPEIVKDGLTGLLVPPANTKALALALKRLIDDPELRSTLGKGGRKLVSEKYDWLENAAEMENLYSKVLNSAQKSL